MTATKQKRNTLLFVGFLLLAGGLHIAANIVHNTVPPHYSVNTMLFCAEFVIYFSSGSGPSASVFFPQGPRPT